MTKSGEKYKNNRKEKAKAMEEHNADILAIQEVMIDLAESDSDYLENVLAKHKVKIIDELKEKKLTPSVVKRGKNEIIYYEDMNGRKYTQETLEDSIFDCQSYRGVKKRYNSLQLEIAFFEFKKLINEVVQHEAFVIPTLEHFAQYLGISLQNLNSYSMIDSDYAEIIERIKDWIVKGFISGVNQGKINPIFGMYCMKVYGKRYDGSGVNVQVTNNTLNVKNTEDMYKELGFNEKEFK